MENTSPRRRENILDWTAFLRKRGALSGQRLVMMPR